MRIFNVHTQPFSFTQFFKIYKNSTTNSRLKNRKRLIKNVHLSEIDWSKLYAVGYK